MWHQCFNLNFTKLREYFVIIVFFANKMYSTILLPELPSSTVLESTPECNQCNQRCLHSACACCLLNATYADYILRADYWSRSRSFVKLQLKHWCHMNYFNDVLATIQDLGTLQFHCCLQRVRELSDFIKNICICVPKLNEGITGLKQHEVSFPYLVNF